MPGPVLRGRQGDRVRITLVNQAPGMPHSIDFQAARLPMDHAMQTVLPHDSLQFEFEATIPGAFMVHCGTPPILLHIAQGMYFPIVVDPKGGWPTRADEEYVLAQSELYPAAAGADSTAPRDGDLKAMQSKEATYVVFNGKAFQYKTHPLTAKPGDRVRLFVVNAGPSFASAFHIVGTIFDKVYVDGNPAHALEGVQTQVMPPGDGIVVETTLREAGTYAFVTHAFADAEKGAVGLIKVAPAVTVAAGH